VTDFDAALERLVTDPAFAAELAADPERALAGYRLDEAEAELLRCQVSADDCAGAAAVEARTTKSSTFGLLSSIGDLSGFGGAGGQAGAAAGRAVGALGDPAAPAWGSGAADLHARTGLGEAPGPRTGLGAAPGPRTGLGDAPRTGLGDAAPPAPEGYRNRVDADGDGDWDKATYRGRADGGVDILVDLDRDGRADFIGHDVDRDWTVDSADYDKDHDGRFEKRMYDDNGDGWLDRTVRRSR
jgi:hypothetical protein